MKGIRHASHGLSEKDLRRLFPEASEAFIQAQLVGAGGAERAAGHIRVTDEAGRVAAWIKDDNADLVAGVHAAQSKPNRRPRQKPLGQPDQGKDASGCRFIIRFTIRSRRPCDWNNYWTKGLEDMVIRAGVLPDDGWKVIREGRVITEKVHRAEDEGTLIEILEA